MNKVNEAMDLENSNLLLTSKEIRDYTQKWLIPNFIENNKLINFYAKAGNGKSITCAFLATHLLEIEAIKQVIYLDADNGIGTLKSRAIDKILDKYPNFYYISYAKTGIKNTEIKTKIFDLAAKANGDQKDTLIIFDSIRNFITGSMSYDEVVMPYLEALQSMRNYYAGVWFLHHQNKQSFSNSENKEYKGATSFIDTPDEAYFVKKRARNGNQLIVTLEPQKMRDDTLPQAIIIDTFAQTLKFDDYLIHSMSEKEVQSLEYAKEIIAKSPSGISRNTLISEIKRLARNDDVEVCGTYALRKFLCDLDGRFYKITRGNECNSIMFYPLS